MIEISMAAKIAQRAVGGNSEVGRKRTMNVERGTMKESELEFYPQISQIQADLQNRHWHRNSSPISLHRVLLPHKAKNGLKMVKNGQNRPKMTKNGGETAFLAPKWASMRLATAYYIEQRCPGVQEIELGSKHKKGVFV